MLQSLDERFALLEPFITAYGPKDSLKRPAVLLFHGCNGVRDFIHSYAKAVSDQGVRAFVIDSFGPRGWGLTFALSFICTGMIMPGYERSGDVLAALHGLAKRSDVDADQLILAGWSHGGWAIMDLMTETLEQGGQAKLRDPDPGPLRGVKGVFLVYPYMGYPARSLSHPWHYQPRVQAVVAEHDVLTSHTQSKTVLAHIRDQGLEVDTLELDATHAFDEDDLPFVGPMVYNRTAHGLTQKALANFIDTMVNTKDDQTQ